jgi:hypothetical protein
MPAAADDVTSAESGHMLPQEADAEPHRLLALPALAPPLRPGAAPVAAPVVAAPPVKPSRFLGIAAEWVSRLRWPGTGLGLVEFMRRVYLRQMERAAGRREPFAPNGDGARLAVIEGGQRARPEAASDCRALLSEARADLARERRAGSLQARAVESLGVLSAHRSVGRQFVNWLSNFPNYYRQTAGGRSALDGGPHGERATDFLAGFIERRLASPGYSFHNGGTAVDFTTTEGGRRLQALSDPGHVRAWKRSWFYGWMGRNARRFHFYQNDSIDEPWHWEHRPDPQANRSR